MMLILLLMVPFAGGVLAGITGALGLRVPRLVACIACAAELTLAGSLLAHGGPAIHRSFMQEWVPRLGISFHFALDGLSLLLVMLTAAIGLIAVAASWKSPLHHPGFYYANMLWTIAGITGVFISFDLFLVYFFWELMLLPLYVIILLWGSGAARAAGIKFIIFTQVSGLFMLLGILILYFHAGASTGVYSFDYDRLMAHARPSGVLVWAMLGFFLAGIVKLGIVPFHAWLPDAYCAAPPGGGILLGGIMSKTGAYLLLRFMVPLFPAESLSFSHGTMILGAVSILYGAMVAIAQTDFKRLIAYSSISHMGFVLLAIGAWNAISLHGAVVQIVSHAVIIAALFILALCLDERLRTSDMRRMGGLWESAPRMGLVMLLFALASMGLPGLGSFTGEFLTLAGSFRHWGAVTVVAASSGIFSVIYALSMMHRVFQGPSKGVRIADFTFREAALAGVLSLAILGIGFYPRPIIALSAATVEALQYRVAVPSSGSPLSGATP
jgi:NADH-quinone oxidoreductase subunit M